MRTAMYCLVLGLFVGALSGPAPAEVVLSSHDREPVLLDRPNPALAGIDKLLVVIISPHADPNKDGPILEELEAKVTDKLTEAGIKTPSETAGATLDVSELKICVDILRLDDAQRCVFHTQTSLASKVSLVDRPQRHIKADVWRAGPQMQATTPQNISTDLTKVVLNQVETFTSCYLIANPGGVRASDPNSIGPAPKAPAASLLIPAPVGYRYVASKNSRVFHRAECSWAARIKPENLVGYHHRIEAIKVGKRPCKRCKP